MRIIQHQFGGIVYTPVNVEAQQAAATSGTTSSTGSSSSSSAEKISGTYAKELIDQIKEYGIQSDVNQFSNKVANILQLAQNPVTGDFNMKDIVKVQQEANKVKLNKENYDNALERLENQNAWSEVAIDTSGRMYVLDENANLQEITPEEYAKNSDSYRALTNKDLLSLRETQSKLAYNQNILHDLQSAVGISEITKYIRDEVKEFGTTETEGYSKKDGKIASGLQKLMDEGPDGIYKYTTKETIADEDVQYALQYLYESLPASYRQALDAKTAAEQGDPTKATDKYKLLGMILTADTSRTYKVDYDKTASASAGYSNAASEGSEKLTTNTYLERIAQTRLDPTTVYISPVAEQVSDKAQLATTAWKAGMLVDKNGNGITEHLNLSVAKGQVEAFKAADSSAITFGNQLVNPEDVKKLVWDGQSELAVVMLPSKNEGGKTVPDFDAFEAFNKLQKWIQDAQPTQLAINQYIKDNFSENQVTYDSKTNTLQFNPNVMMKFLTFSAIASNDVMKISDDSEKYLVKMDRSQGKSIKGWYNNAIQYGKENPNKQDKADKSVGEANNSGFYRGNVYMPIENSIMAMHMSNNEIVPKSNYMNVAEKWEATKAMEQAASAAKDDNWNTTF